MSVFTGGTYGRLAVMLNTLSSLNIEIIIIIIIIASIHDHYLTLCFALISAKTVSKNNCCHYSYSDDIVVSKHGVLVYVTIRKALNNLLPLSQCDKVNCTYHGWREGFLQPFST